MKSLLFKNVKFVFFLLLFCSLLHAQVPQKMSYQVVVRNASNTLVTNSSVRIITSVYRTSIAGLLVYQDWHLVTTNANGLASLEIGVGTNQFGIFSTIDWADGPYFIKTQIDPTGNFSFTIEGSSQLLSVPFALFAEKSNPVNPIFQYSQSGNGIFSTVRNTWVEYIYSTITVAKTGNYLLIFNGNVYNSGTFSGTTFDSKAIVKVENITTSTELISMDATLIDRFYISSTTYYKYQNLQPSRSMVVHFNQGDVLKVYYMQSVDVGVTEPTQSWIAGATSLSITKVGD